MIRSLGPALALAALAATAAPRLAAAQTPEGPGLGDTTGLLERARERESETADPGSLEEYSSLDAAAAGNPWAAVRAPTRPPAESIGDYAAGCLRGAELLDASGPGFALMRLSRRRFFGHPRLAAFVRGLGRSAQARGLGTVLVGDLGQARGGPTMTGHASHQSGLDVDVWFLMLSSGATPTDGERETLSAPRMVVPDFERTSPAWDPRVVDLLGAAADDASVERIFVNPVVKREVCARHAGAAWLAKLRPWWGHDDHLHARLSCAPGDARCRSQEPVPAGDGCGSELAEWFTPERRAEARRRREDTTPAKPPKLPAACAAVLKE